jgi:predicted nuclease with TOPRIM domain
MSDTIVVAIIGLVGSGLGSLIGVIASSKLTQYRIQKLEEQVNKHNNLVERTYRLEGRVDECEHDIRDLKGRVA